MIIYRSYRSVGTWLDIYFFYIKQITHGLLEDSALQLYPCSLHDIALVVLKDWS